MILSVSGSLGEYCRKLLFLRYSLVQFTIKFNVGNDCLQNNAIGTYSLNIDR